MAAKGDVGSMVDGAEPAAGPEGSIPPHPPTRRRGSFQVAAVIAIAAIAVAALGAAVGPLRPTPAATPTSGAQSSVAVSTGVPSLAPTPTVGGSDASPTPPEPGSRGYLADRTDLLQRAVLARTGVEPYATALDDLLAWARRAVRREPRPAVRLRIKGTEGPFVNDTAAAYGLALAHAMTGERQYGEAAARHIMAWVDTTTKTVDTCKKDGACQTSLIISRTVPGFVFAADLLEGTAYLDEPSVTRLRAWLRDVMLPTASELNNNWGDAGTFTRIVLTDYLGDQAGFDAAVVKWRELLDLVKRDGHIPREVVREEGGLGYTQEALDYKVAAAVIAERRGVDLWGYQGSDGGSLKGAVDYLADYMARPDRWPWYDGVKRWPPSSFWELAYSKWRDPDHGELVLERRPQGSLGHSAVRWTTLTNGLPVEAGGG